jgi:bisphosphoglycerate-dependent phosphoglycerate mutase
MVEKRIISFLEQLSKWLKKNLGNVAISCHGNSLRTITRVSEHWSLEQIRQFEAPQDSAVVYEPNYDLSIEHSRERAT